MRRLHATVVVIGALVLVGSMVVAISLLGGGVPDNGTAAAPATPTATDIDTDSTPARPPTVRVLDHADGESVMNPFRDRAWSATNSYVHVGTDGPGQTEPVTVLVVNNGSERSLPVRVSHPPSNTALYDRAPTVSSSEALVFVFHEPSGYAVAVATGPERATVDLQNGDFDCNERTVGVAVEPNGTTATQRVSTLLGCGTP